MKRSAQYVTITTNGEVVSATPCLLAGLSISEGSGGDVTYDLFNDDGSGDAVMRFIAPNGTQLRLQFPAPITFSNMLTLLSQDGKATPQATFELA